MSNIDAIEVLKAIYPSQKEIKTGEYGHVADALDDAIIVLEKQIPYKPTSNVKFGIGKCKCGVEFLDKDTAYCGNCGQKLDWEGKLMSRKCGNCMHSRREHLYGEWVCGNEESEAYGLDIAYDDVCEEWEGKDE